MSDESHITCPTCGSTYPKAGLGGFAGMCPHCMVFGALPTEEDAALLSNEQAGERITRYTLLEQIGSGGMGSVWRAKQEEPFQREIALKIIKLGMDTTEVISRFEAERQALAAMDHPNIAKVLDAGATEEGRPFFVMELIEGEPITDFCRVRKLDLRGRLKLFSTLCGAIEHAHQKGIIHRDLKPSNVLIDTASETPAVKVIDFGVAKAIEQGESARTMYTQVGQMIGTPAYMSPEQARLEGSDIDTRSDIYSLGVLLYELLTGSPPFEPQRLAKAGLVEVCRVLREEDPPKPSTRVGGPNTSEITGFQLVPEKLSGVIRGDLDWIVMKALEKDRSRRYDTANGLAADIRRHLNHEPVEAGAPGNLYRLKKYARRHKVLFSSLLTVALILVLASAISVWQAVRATNAEAEQRVLREEADASRQLADDKNEELQGQLYRADMWRASEASGKSGLQQNISMLTEPWIPREGESDQRQWEWYYLRSARDQPVHTFTLPTSSSGIEITKCDWFPDGKRLIAAGGQVATIWDVETRRRLRTIRIPPGRDLIEMALSPDGEHVALAWKNDTISVFNTESGSLLRSIKTTRMSDIDWAGNEHLGITTYSDVEIWSIHSGEKRRIDIQPNDFPTVCCFSPDGSRLLISALRGKNEYLMEFDVGSGAKLREKFTDLYVTDLCWSPDGKHIAMGSWWQYTAILDAANLEQVRRTVKSSILSWAPDGTELVYGGQTMTIRSLAVTEEKRSRTWDTSGQSITGLTWSPGGEWIAASSSRSPQIQVWAAQPEPIPISVTPGISGLFGPVTSSPLHQQTLSVPNVVNRDRRSPGGATPIEVWSETVSWSPDHRYLAVDFGNSVELWDETEEEIISKTNLLQVAGFEWSPDGDRIALRRNSDGRGVIMLEVPSLEFLWWSILAGNDKEGGGEAVAWVADGTMIAMPSRGNDIALLDPATGTPWRTLQGHTSWVHALALSPDGKSLASGSRDQTCRIWNTETWECLYVLDHSDEVMVLEWSPDNQRLLTGCRDGVVRFWDPRSGRELLSLSESGNHIVDLKWTNDGSMLLVKPWGDQPTVAYDARRAYRAESIRKAREFSNRGDWPSAERELHKALTAYQRPSDQIWVATDWLALRPGQDAERLFASQQSGTPVEQDSDGVVLLSDGQNERFAKRFYLSSRLTLNLHLDCPPGSKAWLEQEELQIGQTQSLQVQLERGWNDLLLEVVPAADTTELAASLSNPNTAQPPGIFPTLLPAERRCIIQQRIEANPGHAKHWRDLAEFELSLERYHEASRPLTKALALDPEHERGQRLLVQLLQQWGGSLALSDRNRSVAMHRASSLLSLLLHADHQTWSAPEAFWIPQDTMAMDSGNDEISSRKQLTRWQGEAREDDFDELANYLPTGFVDPLRLRCRFTMSKELPVSPENLSLLDWQDRFRMQILLRDSAEALRSLDTLLNIPWPSDLAEVAYQRQELLRLKILLQELVGEDRKAATDEFLQIPPRDPSLPRRFIDLTNAYNACLHDQRGWLGSSGPADTDYRLWNQAGTPLRGISFDARGILQLRGGEATAAKVPQHYPERITIPVGQRASHAHFLLSSIDAGAQAGDEIATAVFHYEDGEKATQRIIYGTHVLDWLLEGREKELYPWSPSWVERAVSGREVHLNPLSWINPKSEKTIKEIELISALGKSALFVTAITLEPPLEGIDSRLAELQKPGSLQQTRRTKELLKSKERQLRSGGKLAEADQVREVMKRPPPRDKNRSVRQLDLTSLYNASLYDSRGCEPFYNEFNLSMLPERFVPRHGADFDLRGIIQLNSGVYDRPGSRSHGKDLNGHTGHDYPLSVEIPVGQKADQVNFLLGSINNSHWERWMVVATLRIHYANGALEERPLYAVYDIINWIEGANLAEPPRHLGWTGRSEGEKAFQLTERIFRNPHPDQIIDRIELISEEVMAAPFLLGVTLRDHDSPAAERPASFAFPSGVRHLFTPLMK